MNFWTGDLDRDAHLKSADFLDVGNHPKILFRSTRVDQVGASSYRVGGDLTIRGITRPVTLDVQYLGQWSTPYWEDGVDKGPVIRAGFAASAVIHRHDFQCSWNAPLDRGGLVVGSEVYIDLDIEALAVS
jgi:polyisoprenoid-binding protein YceI